MSTPTRTTTSTPRSTAASLTLQGVTKRFDGFTAVGGVDLDVAPGSLVALLGPSGCGKTTLLRTIVGIERPTDGRLLIDGRDVTDLPSSDRGVGLVFQDFAIFPNMTVRENLGFALRMAGADRARIAQTVDGLAATLELDGLLGRRPRSLNPSELQRVSIGRALAAEPAVMLFDEPLSNVEAGLRMRMRAELRSLHKRFAQTTIYVTHDQTEALALADVVAVMNKGRLEQVATPEELYARPATTFVAGFIGSPPMNLLEVRVAAGRAQGGELGLDVPPGIGDDVAFVGFRAEHLQLRRGPADGDVIGRGRVSTVEPLGSETVVSITVGDALLKSLVDGRSGREHAPGDDVTLAVPAGRRHWFAADGTRATGHDASSPAEPPFPSRTKD